MPQSLSNIVIHIVFSTKGREPIRDISILPSLHAYLAATARDKQCECFRVGGVADHVHLAVRFARTITIAKLVEQLKTGSSRWIKTQSPELAHFSWQNGYSAFSVGPKDLEVLKDYIDGQEEHHRKHTFQEEYRAFLKRNKVEFDERYVWD